MVSKKTIERLIIYKMFCEQLDSQGREHVYSTDLANYTDNKPSQVRRDLMAIGCLGNSKRGYNVVALIRQINDLLKSHEGIHMTLVGVGNLGKAILGYFRLMKPKFSIESAFDIEESKVNRVVAGCRSYPLSDLRATLKGKQVDVGIITVPGAAAQKVADLLIEAGVSGIVNFSPIPVKGTPKVFIENIHMAMTFEKVAFFSKLIEQGK